MNRITKLKKLNNRFETGTTAGLHRRVEDGVVHEIGHLICLGVSLEEFRSWGEMRILSRRSRGAMPYVPYFLSDFVQTHITEYTRNGGNGDTNECQTTAACVHALRRLRCMKNTERYIRGSVKTSEDLMHAPARAPAQIRRFVRTKIAAERGRKILEWVDVFYEVTSRT